MVKGQRKRVYTDEFRQSAVALVLREGSSVKRAAADLGMPENTLDVWVSQSRSGGNAQLFVGKAFTALSPDAAPR